MGTTLRACLLSLPFPGMAWLSIVLSVAAFVFAVVSTVLALRADSRSGRNEHATAHDVRVWLADQDGKDVSVSPQPFFALAPDESDDAHGIPVPLDLDPLELHFVYCWKDGGGYHAWPSNMPPMP